MPPKNPVRKSYYRPRPWIRSCGLCMEDHPIKTCEEFLSLTPDERYEVACQHFYCLNCLACSHNRPNCTAKARCNICGGRHNFLLHDASQIKNTRLTPPSQQRQQPLPNRSASVPPKREQPPPNRSRSLDKSQHRQRPSRARSPSIARPQPRQQAPRGRSPSSNRIQQLPKVRSTSSTRQQRQQTPARSSSSSQQQRSKIRPSSPSPTRPTTSKSASRPSRPRRNVKARSSSSSLSPMRPTTSKAASQPKSSKSHRQSSPAKPTKSKAASRPMLKNSDFVMQPRPYVPTAWSHIFIPTAQIRIAIPDQVGVWHICRASINFNSPFSRIAVGLQSKLNLETFIYQDARFARLFIGHRLPSKKWIKEIDAMVTNDLPKKPYSGPIKENPTTDFPEDSLADPTPQCNSTVDIELGANLFKQVFRNGCVETDVTGVFAQPTALGYVFVGAIE
ncbi:uncharacterized protein [Musca autumnalis]|uniref:uncharacterized protein n=1 Tax=Musca autumnalis TaxID=221902 RepID=UPI003CE76263